MIFEWSATRAAINRAAHGVTFQEAVTVFADPLSITIEDPDHSQPGDERLVVVGLSSSRRTLVVVYSARGRRIRVISARLATRHERNQYEESC